EAGKKRIYKIDQIAVALGAVLEIGCCEDGADRHGVDRAVARYQARIVLGAEPRRYISGRYRGIERYREEVQALLSGNVAEQRRGLACDESKRGDFTPAQLAERYILIVVGGGNRDFKKVEEPAGGNRGTSPAQIDIDLLVREIFYPFDLASGQKMELLVIELGDIAHPTLDARKIVRLPGMIEDIRLQYGKIDAAQHLEIAKVLQRPAALPHRR